MKMNPLSFITHNRKPNLNVAEVYRRYSHRSAYIPLYSQKVPAGFPSPATDFVEARLSADDYLVKNPIATYFVRVKGDSMINAGIFDGDVLIVDRSIEPSMGQIVLAEVDGEFTVKYLGQNKLIPANPSFQPIEFREGQTITLIGVITGSMRKFL
jgi:DNA polymerase V